VKATPQSLPLIPLYVFDRRNGQLIATILRPHARIAADGDRLIFWRQYGGNAGEVLRFDAKAMRQAARP
jgi:hypothetical protein